MKRDKESGLYRRGDRGLARTRKNSRGSLMSGNLQQASRQADPALCSFRLTLTLANHAEERDRARSHDPNSAAQWACFRSFM